MPPQKISAKELLDIAKASYAMGKTPTGIFDFDGTTADTDPTKPGAAKLSSTARSAVKTIHASSRAEIAFATGRSLENISRKLPVTCAISANQGAEIRYSRGHGPNGVSYESAPSADYSHVFSAIQSAVLGNYPKAIVKQKGGTGLPVIGYGEHINSRKKIQTLVGGIMNGYHNLIMYPQDECIDIAIPGFSKEGVQKLMGAFGKSRSKFIGVGNAINDEPMFEAVNAVGDITVRIKNAPSSAAKYYFSKRSEFEVFLTIFGKWAAGDDSNNSDGGGHAARGEHAPRVVSKDEYYKQPEKLFSKSRKRGTKKTTVRQGAHIYHEGNW